VISKDKFGESEDELLRRRITNRGQFNSPVKGHSTRQISHQLGEIPPAMICLQLVLGPGYLFLMACTNARNAPPIAK
jgi:hypothetical protein